MRASIIQHTDDIFDPDIFIVDKEPLGLRGEIKDTLTLLKAHGTHLVLGLRDVLEGLTVADARDTYEAIRLAAPGGLGQADAQDVAETPTETLLEVMRRAADRDLVARQYAATYPDVVDAALRATNGTRGPVIYLSPKGRLLDQARVREIAQAPAVTLLCGRYEGVDERVIEARGLEEVSLGDFVLSGGEPAAIALIDACVRLLPGVLGNALSLVEESFERGLLEYPHYTRPQDWRGRKVPETLLSGHHEKIRAWRLAEAEKITRERRPDLWARYTTGNR